MADESSHRRLAATLSATPATVILSGYPSALYDEIYDGWWYVDVHVTAHSSNAATKVRTGRLERIWMNRPPSRQALPFDLEEATTA